MLRILKWRDNPRLSQWVNVITSVFIREREKVRLSNRDVTVEAEVFVSGYLGFAYQASGKRGPSPPSDGPTVSSSFLALIPHSTGTFLPPQPEA